MSADAGVDGDAATSVIVAMAMAALAGATDVYGLSLLRDVFVSFMSGNTTLLGLALGEGDLGRAKLIAGIIGLFVAGAMSGAIFAARSGRFHAALVMALVAVLLCVPLLHDAWSVPAFVLAMGALNMTMARIGTTSIGLTYVTGALVKLGQGLGHWLAGVREPRDWILQGPMWLALLAGAVAGAVLQHHLGRYRDWPLPLFAALLVPILVRQARKI